MNYFCSSVDTFLLTGSRDVDQGTLMHCSQRAAIIYIPWCPAPCSGMWESPLDPTPHTHRACPHMHTAKTCTQPRTSHVHTHTHLCAPRHTGDALSLFSPHSEPTLPRGKGGKATSSRPLILLRRRLHVTVITADLKVAQPGPAPKLK